MLTRQYRRRADGRPCPGRYRVWLSYAIVDYILVDIYMRPRIDACQIRGQLAKLFS